MCIESSTSVTLGRGKWYTLIGLKPAPVGPESMVNEDGQSQQHVSTAVPKTSSKRPPKFKMRKVGEYIY